MYGSYVECLTFKRSRNRAATASVLAVHLFSETRSVATSETNRMIAFCWL